MTRNAQSRRLTRGLAALAAAGCLAGPAAAQDETPDGKIYAGLKTRWVADVSAEHPWPEYPRPQMQRDQWINLNGPWQYAIAPRDADAPAEWEGTILVPFPVESQLSGVQRPVGEPSRLWYRRTFPRPDVQAGGRLLLHFGAVDWRTEVWINGRMVGTHEGGYDPFTFDITDALRDADAQEITVAVWDPTDLGDQPRGKQVRNPEGIFYTAVTGIWQTVWLEAVPGTFIDSLKILPDVDQGSVSVSAVLGGATAGAGTRVEVSVVEDGRSRTASGEVGSAIAVALDAPRHWSPDDPFLYGLRVRLLDGGGSEIDAVDSYFGMRKIHFAPDAYGFNRLHLNNEPLFQYGPLDQGWWPDGLYTAPTDEALRYDIEITRALGFNMARKHVKVEPARWYYWADKLGLLVWQDMPSGFRAGSGHNIGPNDGDANPSPEVKRNFRRELAAMMAAFHNHPSIVVWVPFNEGWGQHDTNEVLRWTKEQDPSRLVDGPSGWADRGYGDLHDMHRYPGPGMFPPQDDRVSVLGEFGGLGLTLEGNLWWNKRNWGYRSFADRAELRANYDELIAKMRPLIGSGLAAAVYTQTTDVEGEVNGLLTYDRAIVKFDTAHLAALHAPLYGPHHPVIERTVIPTSESEAQLWRYTTAKPADGWEQPGFDDSSWQEGKGGFGTPGTPGAVVGTRWDTADLWIRRRFEWKSGDHRSLHVRIHHDEDAEVYLNGTKVLDLDGWTDGYVNLPVTDEAKAAMREGMNTVAIHVRQTSGGQFIDIGVVDIVEVKSPEEFKALQR